MLPYDVQHTVVGLVGVKQEPDRVAVGVVDGEAVGLGTSEHEGSVDALLLLVEAAEVHLLLEGFGLGFKCARLWLLGFHAFFNLGLVLWFNIQLPI